MTLSTDRLESLILLVRTQKVILDEDLARLYGVKTKVLIQAVKRNIDRFPEDFAFILSYQEVTNLKSQIVISSLQPADFTQKTHIFSKNKTYGGRRSLPYVFTEQGVAMLSSILNSPRAIKTNIEIIRTFVKLRQLIASNTELAKRLNELEKKYDSQFSVIFDAIRKLMAPPDPQKKTKIGF